MTTSDITALNAEVLSETQRLAEVYAMKFEGDVEGELRAWLHIAARREAMVSEVYREAERSYRLPRPHVPAARVAWDALTLIWQHEEVHTRFIETRLADGIFRERALTAELMIWLGTMEGRFLASLTGDAGLRQVLTKLAVRLGALFAPRTVPEFALALAELGPREFFLLCGALETTARECYRRMEVLADLLADRLAHGAGRSLQMENLTRELRMKTLDETFHEQAFGEIAGWVTGNQLDPSLTEQACAQRLAALLPRGTKAVRTMDMYVVTDGGLGKLFKAHGVSLVVEPSARELRG
jgi:hypothetical protein